MVFFDMFASITQIQSHYSLDCVWTRLKWLKIRAYYKTRNIGTRNTAGVPGNFQLFRLCWIVLQPILGHYRLLQLTPTQSRSLQPTPDYSNPLQPTPSHSKPLQLTSGHFNLLHVVLTHCRQIIQTSWQIFSVKYVVLFQLAWSRSYLNYS